MPPSARTLIVNARLANEGREFEGDLRIANDRITGIGSGLSAGDGGQVVDAAGRRLSRCGRSPFEGRAFHSRIGSTWVNGEPRWDGSRLVGARNGQRLAFAR